MLKSLVLTCFQDFFFMLSLFLAIQGALQGQIEEERVVPSLQKETFGNIYIGTHLNR